jgi:predicted kinase
MSSLLVIVTGLPCTDKTALAHRLAEAVPLPIVAKDDIKESPFDALNWSERAWSMKLGWAAVLLLYQMVETNLRAGVPVIAENYFHVNLSSRSRRWWMKYARTYDERGIP